MKKTIFYFICMVALTNCNAVFGPSSPTAQTNSYKPVTNKANTTKIVKEYIPMPLPGQLMPVQVKTNPPVFKTKEDAVNYANQKASIEPNSKRFVNSIMVYPYMEGALYTVYAAPQKMTDLEFAPGEQLISQAAGDTIRWQIAKTYSGEGNQTTEHLLLKPNETGLENNLVIMTTKRVYHIRLFSTTKTYMAAVKWQYPQEEVVAYQDFNPSSMPVNINTSLSALIDMEHVNTHYQIKSIRGDTQHWKPEAVFDDSVHTYIRFPNTISTIGLPMLMIDTGNNQYASTINYRQKGPYMIVDTVFQKAQLITGDKLNNNLAIIQIEAIKDTV